MDEGILQQRARCPDFFPIMQPKNIFDKHPCLSNKVTSLGHYLALSSILY